MGCFQNFDVSASSCMTIWGNNDSTINPVSNSSLHRARHLKTCFSRSQNENSPCFIERYSLLIENKKFLFSHLFDFCVAVNRFTRMNCVQPGPEDSARISFQGSMVFWLSCHDSSCPVGK